MCFWTVFEQIKFNLKKKQLDYSYFALIQAFLPTNKTLSDGPLSQYFHKCYNENYF